MLHYHTLTRYKHYYSCQTFSSVVLDQVAILIPQESNTTQ